MRRPLLPLLLLAALLVGPSLARRPLSTEAGQGDIAVVPTPKSWASRHLLQLGSCMYTCDSKCAMCVGTVDLGNGTKAVTIDASGCKGSQTLSWICCRGASIDGGITYAQNCTLKEDGCTGAPTYEYGVNKCNNFVTATFVVPVNATLLTVQVHDGKANGSLACPPNSGACCGGAGSSCAASGVCEWVINLTDEVCLSPTLGNPNPNACESHEQCTNKVTVTGPCGVPQCVNGACVEGFAPASQVCRDANLKDSPCDAPEYCTGSSTGCPEDVGTKDNTRVCRPATDGGCDVAEYCDGFSKECGADLFKEAGELCRAAIGDCDKEEKCSGDSPDCPEDGVMEAGVTCRQAAAGGCDVEEKCDGKHKTCPPDAYKPSDWVCRESMGACDKEEKCTGTGPQCPPDAKQPTNHVCRPKKDNCDLPEMCTGGNECPMDRVLRDKAKVFKCGRDCFYCGMPPAPVGANIMTATILVEMTPLKNTWALGSCNTGSCDNHILVQAPQFDDEKIKLYCEDTLPLVCPNGKALSNVIHGVCNEETGKWNCAMKQEAPFAGAVTAPWATPTP